MATAATLSILVEANTSAATSNLRSVQSTLNRTGSSARAATTHTDRFSSASSKLGSTLSNAAKAAGAAALAYISIAQARDAIDTTEELAKSTLTLHKNLGLSIKASSEWAAVAKVRGVATTQLGMAFKTLSTQVESAKDGSTTAKENFDKLGISMDQLRKMNTSDVIMAVSDGIHELGAGTARTAIASRLFGRGWQTIVPVLRDGSKALKEQLGLANKYGATFGGKSLQSIKDLIAAQRELQFAQLGLQIAFTEKVAPALMTAGLAIANFLNEMRKGKGVGGDFRRIMGSVVNTIGDVIDVISSIVRIARPVLNVVGDQFRTFADAIRDAVKTISDILHGRFGAAFLDVKDLTVHFVRNVLRILGDFTAPIRHVVGHIGEVIGEGFSKAWHGVVGVFHRGAEAVRSIIHSMGDAIQNVMNGIRKVFHGVASVVRTVVHFIVNAVNKAVNALGSLKDKIPDITPSLPSLPSIPSIPSPGDIVGSIPGLQRGGGISGSGLGDRVPAMLEPGEFVVNRRAAAKHRDLLKAINFRDAPRFATGGFAGMQPAITALAKTFLNRFGGYMSSGFRPGDSGFHGRGLAADIVPSNWGGATAYANQIGQQLLEGIHQGPPGSNVSWDSGHQVPPSFWGAATWAEHVSHIHLAVANAIKGAVGGAMAQIPNIAKHIQGVGPLAGMARGAAKKVRGAANAYLAKIAPAMSTDIHGVSDWHGINSAAEFIPFWDKVNPSVRWAANAFSKIVPAESTWNPRAENFIGLGHRGWYQFDPPTWAQFGKGSWDNAFDPLLATVAAGNVAAQEGQSGIMNRWASTFQGFKHGGLMPPYGGNFAGGGTVPGPIGSPRTIVAHGGESVGPPVVNVILKGDLGEFIDVQIDGALNGEKRLGRQRARMRR